MFGISMWEFVLIVAVALVFLGPRQFADAAKAAGRLYRELQKLADDVRNTVDLDALTAPTPDEKLRPKQETPAPALQDYSVVTPGDRKSGPDFYADLLAGSREDEEPKTPEDVDGSQGPAKSTDALSQEKSSVESGRAETDAGKSVVGAIPDHPTEKPKQ